MEINLIIRELLAKHNYISLPGIGSFIQKYEPAHPSTDGLSFVPPKQIITFDNSRTFNDEAIENYLFETHGISRAEATKTLDEFIKDLTNTLNQGKAFTFENVGILSKDSTGKLQFDQAEDTNAAIATYGLHEVSVSKTLTTKTERIKVEQPTVLKEISKPNKSPAQKIIAVFSIIIGTAAIVAAFIFIPDLRFWEQFLNKKNASELLKDTSKTSIPQKQVIAKIDSSLTKKDSLSKKVDERITDNSVKKTALYYEEPKKQDSKTYYLIVGSFGKIENAQKLSEKFAKKGFKPQIIQGANMYRVSINQFSDKSLALAEFNKFRTQNPNESIWLLGQ